MNRRAAWGVWWCLMVTSGPALAQPDAQRAVHLLDYVQVDYGAAVQDGAVVSAEEFAEMREFTAAVATIVGQIDPDDAHPALHAGAAELVAAVQQRAAPAVVSAQARALRDALVETYAIQAAPRRAPDVALGGALYAQQCASCHGATGRGDGPAGAVLEPPPTDFTDAARAAQRSVHGYYNTITLGVEGTGMAPYAALPEDTRWALAFYVAGLSGTAEQRAQGERLWADAKVRQGFSGLAEVTRRAPAELSSDAERAVLAYLRADPRRMEKGTGGPLAHARRKLDESLRAYRAGDVQGAYDAALSAYLDGYELTEQALASRDGALALDIERRMLAYRESIKAARPVEAVEGDHEALIEALDQAAGRLGAEGLSPALGFVSALVILVREGLEAVLVLAAIVAFLRRAQRPDALRYVHLGWIGAFVAGIATAAVAVWVVNISGAVRELTEGVSALVAAGVLFYMGYWMHDKAHARRWQAYIGERLSGALGGGTVWALVLVSFLAVYRELFETILFYQALWLQTAPGAHGALLAGVGVGAAVLAVATVAVLRLSVRMPLGLFFGVSAVFMYALAVVFAGKGVMALQEAGRVPLSVVPVPRIDWLGVYPSAQALAAQGVLLSLALVHVLWMRRHSRLTGQVRAPG